MLDRLPGGIQPTFLDAYRRTPKVVTTNFPQCPRCKGTGDLNLNRHERVWDKCPDCNGHGELNPYELIFDIDLKDGKYIALDEEGLVLMELTADGVAKVTSEYGEDLLTPLAKAALTAQQDPDRPVGIATVLIHPADLQNLQTELDQGDHPWSLTGFRIVQSVFVPRGQVFMLGDPPQASTTPTNALPELEKLWRSPPDLTPYLK